MRFYCPECGYETDSEMRYCPRCSTQAHPTIMMSKDEVSPNDGVRKITISLPDYPGFTGLFTGRVPVDEYGDVDYTRADFSKLELQSNEELISRNKHGDMCRACGHIIKANEDHNKCPICGHIHAKEYYVVREVPANAGIPQGNSLTLRYYDLQYKLIPFIIHKCNASESGHEEELGILLNVDALKGYIIERGYTHCEINIDDIHITQFRQNPEVHCILYNYPDPFRVPLAKYALVVFKKENNGRETARYFTWELSENTSGILKLLEAKKENPGAQLPDIPKYQWTLGESTTDGHANYGTRSIDLASSKDFLKEVLKLFYGVDYADENNSAHNESGSVIPVHQESMIGQISEAPAEVDDYKSETDSSTSYIPVDEPYNKQEEEQEVHVVKNQRVADLGSGAMKKNSKYILWWVLFGVMLALGIILFFVFRPSPDRFTSVHSVFISGNTVYAVGSTCRRTSLTDTPTLWINGTPLVIGEEGNFNHATSVYVSGDDVFVTICEDNNAILWTNGVRQVLGEGEANCVFVDGNDVYVGGSTLWKNGINQYYSGTIKAIQVYKGDVYTGGYVGDYFSSEACVWKNGEPYYLGKGRVNAITISENGDLFAAGFIKTGASARDIEAVMWKNGIPHVLERAQGDEPYSMCILDDGRVLISGMGVSSAFLWFDDEYLSINDGGPAYSLTISKGRVYVGGNSNDAKCPVWFFTPEEQLDQITLTRLESQ